MIKAGVKEARQHLTEYLNLVEKGEEIIITRRNEPIAKIIPIRRKVNRELRDHKALRESIRRKGKPLSEIVLENRKEESW